MMNGTHAAASLYDTRAIALSRFVGAFFRSRAGSQVRPINNFSFVYLYLPVLETGTAFSGLTQAVKRCDCPHLIHVRRSNGGNLHSVPKINEVFIRTFLLFCNQAIAAGMVTLGI